MNGRALGLIVTLLVWLVTTSSQASPIHGAGKGATIWVPDYYGGFVRIYTFDYTVNPATFTSTKIDVAARNCNPNALTVQDGSLYVVCNGDFGGIDQILVFDAARRAFIKRITGIDAHGTEYFSGASLIGILFDAKGNLWTTGYASNTLLRIPARELARANPRIDREVIDSPDQPAGMALDQDNSIWIVGQFSGGILVNFTNAVLNAPGSFLAGNPLNPSATLLHFEQRRGLPADRRRLQQPRRASPCSTTISGSPTMAATHRRRRCCASRNSRGTNWPTSFMAAR